MINQLKHIDAFVSQQASEHNLLDAENKKQFEDNSSHLQQNLEKLFQALNLIHEMTDQLHDMFEWMRLFDQPM